MNETRLCDFSLEQLRDLSSAADAELLRLRHLLTELERIFGDNETIRYYEHKIDSWEQIQTQVMTAIMRVKVEKKLNEQ